MVGLLILQLVLCSAILYREVFTNKWRNFAGTMFFAAYGILYIVEPLILHLFYDGPTTIVAGVTARLDDPYVHLLYNAYGIGLLLTYWLLAPASSTTAAVPPSASQGPLPGAYATGTALLIIGGFAVFVYGTGMNPADLLSASRFAWFTTGSLSLLWLTVASYFMALTAAWAYFALQANRPRWWLMATCLAVVVLHGLITKDRKWIIFLASGWLAGRYDAAGRRVNVSRAGVVTLALLFVVLLFSQFLRDVAFRFLIGEQVEVLSAFGDWWSRLIEFGDISYFYRASLEAIHQHVVNGFAIPLGLFRRLTFFFLPVSYSGGLKVEDIAATFSDVVDGGSVARRGNMPPGLFGLFVISFGWLASLFLIPLIAVLLRKLDNVIYRGTGLVRLAILPLYTSSVVLAFRGDESSAVYFMISTLICLVLIRTVTVGSRLHREAIG